MAEQIKVIDKRRIKNYIDILPEEYVDKVNVAIKIAVGLCTSGMQEGRKMKGSNNNKKVTSIYVKNRKQDGTSREYYKFIDYKRKTIVERTEIIRKLKSKRKKQIYIF